MTHLRDLVRQSSDYSEGQSDADREFAAGRLALRDFGPEPPWWQEAIVILRDRYQIAFDSVDIARDPSLIARSIGYNERMREHISDKFGEDVVEIVCREAEAHG